MATLTLDKLNKRYDNGYRAIRELDLHVEDGEFLVLVGPSGCGKSTVLRMIAGLEEITGGEMLIDGIRVNELGPRRRDIAMVFQSYALYPNMTVAQNIAFAMTLKKVPKAEIARKVGEVAQMLELTAVLDRKPGQLSGGQRQRVAMGRAIVREPRLFLMDEPLSNLDAQLRVQTRAEISRLQRRLSITTIYVTHDQVEAMTMGDRVAVLRSGELMQCASPRELYETPANMFVAQFIGSPSMNVVVGEIVTTDDAVSVRIGEQSLRVEPSTMTALPGLRSLAGRRVGVGLRPGALGGDGTAALDVTVELVEMLGSELLVHTTLDAPAVSQTDDGVVIGASPTSTFVASLDPRRIVHEGDRMRLTVDTERMHLFDLDTGAALGRA